MVDFLKKLDKKFLIFAAFIILFPIILVLFLAIVRGCGNSQMSYKNYEEKMISATQRYLKGKLPTEEAEFKTVTLKKLVDKGYIKSPEKALKDDTCKGSVTVRMNGSSFEINNGGFLNYTVSLNCKEYNTVHLVDKITENIVETESGLYETEDGYIFRGNKVNNYINFFGQTYRIMSIDKDGILKLIKDSPEGAARIWDNKYNTQINKNVGKSIYKDSVILSYLNGDYQNNKKFGKKSKQHMVAYDVCVGKRSKTDYSISKAVDCSEILENQVLSLINVSDFAAASTDEDCISTSSRACRNYNYLSNIASSTWTLNSVSENTYEVFYESDGLQEYQEASVYNEYNIVIYVDGNELYSEGSGTAANPYIIK